MLIGLVAKAGGTTFDAQVETGISRHGWSVNLATWEKGTVLRCDLNGLVQAIVVDDLQMASAIALGAAFNSSVIEPDRCLASAFIAAAIEGAAFGCLLRVKVDGLQRQFSFDALAVNDGLVILAKRASTQGELLPADLDDMSALNNRLINRQRDLVRALMEATRLAQAGYGRPSHRDNQPSFTAAEKEVLPLLLEGAPNHVIAQSLGIEVSAVKARLRAIYRKLEVSSRGQAIRVLLGGESKDRMRYL